MTAAGAAGAAGASAGGPHIGGTQTGGAQTASIGSVLDALRADFPEITISKIRFLESEGLISPARTASGYRQFSPADVARLRFVLSAQRDHYLPLKVIRTRLDEFDRAPTAEGPTLPAAVAGSGAAPGPDPADFAEDPRGAIPGVAGVPGPRGGGAPAAPGIEASRTRSSGPVPPVRLARPFAGTSAPDGDGSPAESTGAAPTPGAPTPTADPGEAVDARVPTDAASLSREGLLGLEGVDEALLEGLATHGVLRPDASGQYGPEAAGIARTAASLSVLGVEPRLLRGLRAGAEREVGLLTQLVTPVARGRAADAARRAEDLSTELATLSGRLHALLVGVGLRDGLRR